LPVIVAMSRTVARLEAALDFTDRENGADKDEDCDDASLVHWSPRSLQ